MRLLNQLPTPSALGQAIADLASFETLRSEVKSEIRRVRGLDQFGLCGYCCCKLPSDTALQRIAHVIPRSVDSTKALDINNLVISCSSGRQLGQEGPGQPSSCDISQGAEPVPISPLEERCTIAFHFSSSGSVTSVDADADAEDTIRILELNSSRLREARMTAIDQATQEKLEDLALYRSGLIGGQGPIYEFAPIVEYVLGP